MYITAYSRFALLCNDVSHWLGASLESAPYIYGQDLEFQIVLVYLWVYGYPISERVAVTWLNGKVPM